ncbi:MAG: hypothetical protein ACRC3B_14220, partial [Bacteroidia bacterium]
QPGSEGFFATRLQTLDMLLAKSEGIGGSVAFKLNDVTNSQFSDYIGLDSMSEANRLMMEFLFSGKSVNKHGKEINLLKIDMEIGFVGNPNVGSVVLNQIRDSEEFIQFANAFTDKDRIFIISSIFGGTGAAGFPSLLKNIRDAQNNPRVTNKEFIRQAPIGALTVLPYFNVQASESSPIQVSQFIGKTKAALRYYEKSVNPSVNAMYYIADRPDKPYENDAGNGGQKNEAHLIELFGALSVIDFLEKSADDLVNINGKPVKPQCFEFGVRSDKPSLHFHDLGDTTLRRVSKQLTQFMYFRNYLRDELQKSIGRQRWCNDHPEIGSSFLSGAFYRNDINEFMKLYDEWLSETAANRRGFQPFIANARPEALISGIEPEKGIFRKKFDYHLFNNDLNETSKGAQYASAEGKFFELFYSATQKMIQEQFVFFKK